MWFTPKSWRHACYSLKLRCRLLRKVNLVVGRIVGDHDKALPTMRKAVNFKEGLLLHQAAGLFLHFLRALQGVSPAGSFTDARSKLEDQFRQGFLDPDLQHVLQVSAPPGDPKSIAAFRTEV